MEAGDRRQVLSFVAAKRAPPPALCATIFAKPRDREMVDTFITEVSQDTWIFFPWDLDVAYVAPISGGTD